MYRNAWDINMGEDRHNIEVNRFKEEQHPREHRSAGCSSKIVSL